MSVQVLHGDALAELSALPDASVDAVVTDPPYGIGFMGKQWDRGKSFVERKPERRNTFDHVGGNHNPTDSADAARTRRVEGQRFGAWCEQWATECLRVLKPGGHLLAFGGTRTWHRLTAGIEDAGFEIRDQITWLYGSGFPKSLNIGGGWGTALKPASEPIVVARKPLVGTVAANVTEHGTGALNIDACRVGTEARVNNAGGKSSLQRVSRVAQGYRDHVTTSVGRPTEVIGRWPANVVLSHANTPEGGAACADGCVDGCPVAELDAQSGQSSSGNGTRVARRRSNGAWTGSGMLAAGSDGTDKQYFADSGGASRFFPAFRYQAKAPARERPKVDGVAHPTVKPLALMRWLCRLVCPPGGVILDPFAGSGTTGEAAAAEGFDAILIEREAEYLPLIEARLANR